jgi:hypothetical protein
MGTSAVNYQPWPEEIRGLATYAKQLAPESQSGITRHL